MVHLEKEKVATRMNARSFSRVCTAAVAIIALLSFAKYADAQTECAAKGGVLVSATGVPDVCYPVVLWPYSWWGCSWHSCAPGLICIPTSFPPFFTCAPIVFTPTSPCCPKNQKYCYKQVPGPKYCKSERWVSDIPDCTSPENVFCTRRQRAIPTCVPATCDNIQCPKCHRCVTTKAGPRCVRTCEWGCTWCPKGTFCVENYLYGAICIPWPWWQYQKVAVAVPVDPTKVTLTCAMVKPGCPNGQCIDTEKGPQCGLPCPYDTCSNSDVAPDPPTLLQFVLAPTCKPGCGLTPAFVEPVNTCVNLPAPCTPPQVCVEGATANDRATCQTL